MMAMLTSVCFRDILCCADGLEIVNLCCFPESLTARETNSVSSNVVVSVFRTCCSTSVLVENLFSCFLVDGSEIESKRSTSSSHSKYIQPTDLKQHSKHALFPCMPVVSLRSGAAFAGRAGTTNELSRGGVILYPACEQQGQQTLDFTLDFTIRIDSTPTFSYFDLYLLYSACAAHCVQYIAITVCLIKLMQCQNITELWKYIYIYTARIYISTYQAKRFSLFSSHLCHFCPFVIFRLYSCLSTNYTWHGTYAGCIPFID